MDQIILDPESEPKSSWCWSKKFRCLELDLEIGVWLHSLGLSNQHTTLSRHVASNCRSLLPLVVIETSQYQLLGDVTLKRISLRSLQSKLNVTAKNIYFLYIYFINKFLYFFEQPSALTWEQSADYR